MSVPALFYVFIHTIMIESLMYHFLFLFLDVIFSTAHKAKGLEFDTVCLTDDYPINTNHLTNHQDYYQSKLDFQAHVIQPYAALPVNTRV